MTTDHGFMTRSIHAGEAPDPSTGAHGVPLYQNATYAFASYERVEAWRSGAPHFLYAREGSPTVHCLELKLANLEGAEASVGSATGMAAISATLLHLARNGGHLVASTDIYSVTKDFLLRDLPALGAAVDLVDFTNADSVKAAIRPDTRALFTETFSNPLLKVADIPLLGSIARRHDIPLVVDNTFLSPALCRPLNHGADIVVHSATKYLSGHGNMLGGIVCGPQREVAEIAGMLSRLGATMNPFAAWLLLAGIKTLKLRAERHSLNASLLANLLQTHPEVAAVHYPGLATHPGHETARSLVENHFGGMLSVELRGGEPAVRRFLNALSLPTIAVSLGDTATLVWPIGGHGLVRISVGLEDGSDLEADFSATLQQVNPSAR